MKKSIEFLFTLDDEEAFSQRIKEAYPSVVFVDDMYWPTPVPPTRASITHCESRFVYIWNRQIFPELRCIPRKHGGFHGPQSGVVIQIVRSKVNGNELLSGTMSVGFDEGDTLMKSFAEGVWAILKKQTPMKVVQIEPETGEVRFRRSDIRLGNDAYRWCKANDARVLRFYSSPSICMRPAD